MPPPFNVKMNDIWKKFKDGEKSKFEIKNNYGNENFI